MRDDSDRLYSCPFCGGFAVLSSIEDESGPDYGGHFVQCTNGTCGASTPLIFACGDDPVPLLIERWNRRSRVTPAKPRSWYHEDFGPVLWWRFPINEPPYVGTPHDDDWPGYHTHWTLIDVPAEEGVTC